jgi:hypothetical protein
VVIIPATQVAAKDQRVTTLATQICALLRSHPDRWEALEAIGVARILFRPPDSETIDEMLQSLSGDHESLSVAQ